MSAISFLAAGLCCWMAMSFYWALFLGNLSWLLITVSLMLLYTHNTRNDIEDDQSSLKTVIFVHAASCAAWLIAGIWVNGPMWTFFWTTTMAANVLHATHFANKKAAGFSLFKWVNFVTLGSMIVYALVFTWYKNVDNVLL